MPDDLQDATPNRSCKLPFNLSWMEQPNPKQQHAHEKDLVNRHSLEAQRGGAEWQH